MGNSFTKLKDGTWGVRCEPPASAGASVLVTKRDGTSDTKVLGREIWTDGKVALYALAPKPDPVASTGGGASAPRYRSAHGAGAAANVPGYAKWCTGRVGCGCFDCAS